MKKNRVTLALKSARETKALCIGQGAIANVGKLFSEQFPGKQAVIVADNTTYELAGKSVGQSLAECGIAQQPPVIFTADGLYAEYAYVEQLVDALKLHSAVPVAVGSGTINDLSKLAAHLTARPYCCVATAASMDGYTAYGASITARGAKQTFSCPAPQCCLADVSIIARAPQQMTAAGYADLLAKITAGADWLLADALRVEPIDAQAWSIVQDGLPQALSDPDGARCGNPETIHRLIEGLMLGGFAMQWAQTSRPASGAEHQFSHLWNMEHHTNQGQQVSHGFQVAIGTLAIIALYEQMLASPIATLDVEACCAAWQPLNSQQRAAKTMFAGTDFVDVAVAETSAKYLTRDDLRHQLHLLKSSWDALSIRLRRQLIPFADAQQRLQQVGAPTRPEDIGIAPQHLRSSFLRALHIRRRFTLLDIALRTGMLNRWVDGAMKMMGQHMK
jgi:glycerol-1-phosphate dehydrogenase [NAD(P)+]